MYQFRDQGWVITHLSINLLIRYLLITSVTSVHKFRPTNQCKKACSNGVAATTLSFNTDSVRRACV